jgi:Flp pilus assembly protein TadG
MGTIRLMRRVLGREHGAELIEFAIALPLLLMVVAGIIDFGILFQRYETVTNAAREGARVGILPDYAEADVQARVNSYLAAAGLTATAPAPAVDYDNVEVSPGGPTVSVVRVTVQYPHDFLFIGPVAAAFFTGGGPADLTLSATSSMRLEVAAAAP